MILNCFALEIFMSKKRRAEQRFFVEGLLEKVKTRELTEEEIDKLTELFIEAHGYLPTNLCLHPQWLIKKWEALDFEDEDDEIDAWYQKDGEAYMDNTPINIQDKDISFMCEVPDDCLSHKTYGFDCRCVRTNFKTPTAFRLWLENELTELKDELKDFLPKH